MSILRMPISTASRKGLSAVVAAAEQQGVVLTSHGRAVARVDGPERIEEIARQVREARVAMLDAAADLAAGRTARLTLDEMCERLGLDAERIRRLADEHRTEPA